MAKFNPSLNIDFMPISTQPIDKPNQFSISNPDSEQYIGFTGNPEPALVDVTSKEVDNLPSKLASVKPDIKAAVTQTGYLDINSLSEKIPGAQALSSMFQGQIMVSPKAVNWLMRPKTQTDLNIFTQISNEITKNPELIKYWQTKAMTNMAKAGVDLMQDDNGTFHIKLSSEKDPSETIRDQIVKDFLKGNE